MVFVWSGLGFVALLVPVVCVILSLAVGTFWWDASDNAKAFRALTISFVVGCGLSAVGLWFLGRWMNRRKANGEMNGHTFFFIPVHYWAFVWAIIGGMFSLRMLVVK